MISVLKVFHLNCRQLLGLKIIICTTSIFSSDLLSKPKTTHLSQFMTPAFPGPSIHSTGDNTCHGAEEPVCGTPDHGLPCRCNLVISYANMTSTVKKPPLQEEREPKKTEDIFSIPDVKGLRTQPQRASALAQRARSCSLTLFTHLQQSDPGPAALLFLVHGPCLAHLAPTAQPAASTPTRWHPIVRHRRDSGPVQPAPAQ